MDTFDSIIFFITGFTNLYRDMNTYTLQINTHSSTRWLVKMFKIWLRMHDKTNKSRLKHGASLWRCIILYNLRPAYILCRTCNGNFKIKSLSIRSARRLIFLKSYSDILLKPGKILKSKRTSVSLFRTVVRRFRTWSDTFVIQFYSRIYLELIFVTRSSNNGFLPLLLLGFSCKSG